MVEQSFPIFVGLSSGLIILKKLIRQINGTGLSTVVIQLGTYNVVSFIETGCPKH